MSTQTTLPEEQTRGNQARKEITDISSMLLPLDRRVLLLPGVAVAEIVNFSPPEPEHNEETPAWFLGNIFWRNQRVPLISFEAMVDGSSPLASKHCRIAILNNTGLNPQLSFFAILLQATPKLLRLTSEELFVNHEKILETGEKLHVVVGDQDAVIPDIQLIESSIIQYLQLA